METKALPALRGSEKQIKWAETLRAKALRTSWDTKDKTILEMVSGEREFVAALAEELPHCALHASFWIELREGTGDYNLRAAILKSGGSETDAFAAVLAAMIRTACRGISEDANDAAASASFVLARAGRKGQVAEARWRAVEIVKRIFAEAREKNLPGRWFGNSTAANLSEERCAYLAEVLEKVSGV